MRVCMLCKRDFVGATMSVVLSQVAAAVTVALIDAHPKAVQLKGEDNKYPLNVALRTRAPPAVSVAIIAAGGLPKGETAFNTAVKVKAHSTVIDALSAGVPEFRVCVAYLQQGKSTQSQNENRCEHQHCHAEHRIASPALHCECAGGRCRASRCGN